MSKSNSTREISSLKDKIRRQSNQLDELAYQDAEKARIIASLNKEIQELQYRNQSLIDENDELRRNIRELETDFNRKLDLETKNTENMKSSYESVIQELKNQSSNQCNDIAKLAAEISDYDVKLSELRQENSKLKNSRKRIAASLESTKRQFERERKLIESQIRTDKLMAETNYNQMLEEQKTRAETEKKKLYAYGIEAFSSHFDLADQINEKSYKNVIEKAKKTIESLQKLDTEIRNMLNISTNQTTLDAVAQLLMRTSSNAQYD